MFRAAALSVQRFVANAAVPQLLRDWARRPFPNLADLTWVMRLNAVGAPAGWLPLSRVHPVRPSWEEGQLHSSERSPHKRSGFIFGSNSCVPNMRGSPGVSGDISFPTDLFVLGHLYLSCRNSQIKCAVSQRCSRLVEVGNPASRHFSNANITSKALRHHLTSRRSQPHCGAANISYFRMNSWLLFDFHCGS